MFFELAVLLCLQAPVPGRVVGPYAPTGLYSGHWGLDLAAAFGSPVRAGGDGVVTFASSVAGMLSVTIDHGSGLKSSVSFLSEILVEVGSAVEAGEVVGKSGLAHGGPEVHFSVRLNGEYTDPHPYLICAAGDPSRLYLLPPPGRAPARTRRGRWIGGDLRGSYPRRRAQRSTRGNLRPSPHRPPPGGRGRLSPARA